ncbi:hypothetical protein [Pediococcus ethanolidurans]|uniref:hypothetical protein n=1 Tax=Pediococcus ethanolidurans TaxID=319653 RepID=UPI00070A3598|nr:hypothetical protein [Pediococcus ethanolidurans]GEN94503.1 hypothetical protein PET01_05530 [Pediococcus ethanolidurans]
MDTSKNSQAADKGLELPKMNLLSDVCIYFGINALFLPSRLNIFLKNGERVIKVGHNNCKS